MIIRNHLPATDVFCVASPLHACRVVIATHKGRTLTAFGLDECPGGPHEARIVRRAALLDALRSAVPEQAIRYGASVAAVRATAKGVDFPSSRLLSPWLYLLSSIMHFCDLEFTRSFALII